MDLFKRVGPRTELAAVALLFALLFQLWGFLLGQDVSWDQGNYHLSSVYAWLHHKPWPDYAVSQQQSWFNPLPGLPAYLIVTGLPARFAAICLALLPVLNATTLWLIIRRFVFPDRTGTANLLALACTFAGVTGTIHLSVVVATTMTESWMPALIFLALYGLLAAHGEDSPSQCRWLAWAGFCLGLATGMKPIYAPYIVGAICALAVMWRPGATGALPMLSFAAGGIFGFACGGAWWAFALWQTYGDPVFPMFSRNGNAWIGQDALSKEHFAREHWWQLFLDPFLLAIGDHSRPLSTGMPVRDARYLVGFYGSMIFLVAQIWRRQAQDDGRGMFGTVIAVFFLVSYVTWVFAFNIDRYAIPLELLAPTVAALAVQHLYGLSSRRAVAAFLIFLALIVAGSRPIKTYRKPLAATWFELQVPPGLAQDDTLYVMCGWDDLAWLSMFEERLGPHASFVRVGGNLRIDPDRALGRRISSVINAHTGPIRSLRTANPGGIARDLAKFGLAEQAAGCREITSQIGQFVSCPLVRTSGGISATPGSAEASGTDRRNVS